LATWLADEGHHADHVQDVGLREADDSPIWQYALKEQAVIVTKDEDFANRVRQSRHSPVVVWLRIGNCTRGTLLAWIAPLLPSIVSEIQEGQHLIEVR